MSVPTIPEERARLRRSAERFQSTLCELIWLLESSGRLSAADYTLLQQWQELRQMTERTLASLDRLAALEARRERDT